MGEAIHPETARLTSRSIGHALRDLSLPLVLSSGLLTSYQLVNTFWVGRLGSAALAGVSVSFPVIFLLVCLGGGLAVAGSILVAQYAGACDSAMLRHVAAQALLSVVAVALLFSIVGWFGASYLLRLMDGRLETLEQSTRYLKVSCLSIVFVFIFEMCQSILRGIGVVRPPFYIMTCSVALNLILDPVFIFGLKPIPAGGVVGAAYATLLTQALTAAASLWILFRTHYGVRFRFMDFSPCLSTITRIVRLGTPAALEQSISALGLSVLTTIVSGFGTTALAAYGVAFRVFLVAIIPALGISMATTTLVGQTLGAGQILRAKQSAAVSAWYAFWILTVIAAPVFACAGPIVGFFAPHDRDVILDGATALRFMALSFGSIGVYFSLLGSLRGAGDTLVPMILTFTAIWIIQIPVAYVLGHFTSLAATGLWCSFPISDFLTALLAIRQLNVHAWRQVPSQRVAEEV